MLGLHHLRSRINIARGLEPFPATNAWKRFLDYLMYAVGIVAPIALVPQIIQIYSAKSAEGVSILTWLLLTLVNTLWAIYGAAHKDKQIFFANALITVFDLVIVAGILLYPAISVSMQ